MTDADFARKLERVERGVAEVERLANGDGLEASRELVSTILEVHQEALGELVQAVRQTDPELVRTFANKPKVAWLLGLHGLNPEPLEDRAREALRATEALVTTGARAELVAVAREHVHVRVSEGTGEGRALLARTVERALSVLAPEAEVRIERVPASDGELYAPERLVRRREAAQ